MDYEYEWPRVTSPLARSVLAAVERKQPALSFYEDSGLPLEVRTRQEQYRARIRRLLDGSGLALLIPGGEGLVPDITAAMPQPWRTLARFSRPRNHAQLALTIMRHLNWYLDPHQPPIMPFRLHQAAATIAIVLLIICWRLVPMLLEFMYQFWLPGLALAFALLGGLFLWISTAQADGTFMERTNRNEFYRYLCRAYSDPAEEPRPRKRRGIDSQAQQRAATRQAEHAEEVRYS